MPSSTPWCTTPSRRPCWPIRARSASGTSTRLTSQTSWKKVGPVINAHRRLCHSNVLAGGTTLGSLWTFRESKCFIDHIRALRPFIHFLPGWRDAVAVVGGAYPSWQPGHVATFITGTNDLPPASHSLRPARGRFTTNYETSDAN